MEQLLLVGLWYPVFKRAAAVLGLKLEFAIECAEEDRDGNPTSVWAKWVFSVGRDHDCHEVSLVFRPDSVYLWLDGKEQIDEQGDPPPWKAATTAEIITALKLMPRGTATTEDCDNLEQAYLRLQGGSNPIPPPPMLKEIRRQIERDERLASLRALDAIAHPGYAPGPELPGYTQ